MDRFPEPNRRLGLLVGIAIMQVCFRWHHQSTSLAGALKASGVMLLHWQPVFAYASVELAAVPL